VVECAVLRGGGGCVGFVGGIFEEEDDTVDGTTFMMSWNACSGQART